MKTIKVLCKFLVIFLIFITIVSVGSAEKYPSKPIHLYCNYGAGGTGDLSTRIIAESMEKILGVPVIVEDKPGGGGTLGPSLIAAAKPDGYLIGLITGSPSTTLPYLAELTYNPAKSFEFIGQYCVGHHPIAVNVDSPWYTVKDIINYARENPGKFKYATAGAWNQAHVAVFQLALTEGVEFKFIPFSKGGATAMMQLLGGHLDAVCVSDFAAPARAGKIRLIFETGPVEILGFEDVPTLRELGYKFNSIAPMGLIAPAGTPKEIISTLTSALEETLKNPQVVNEIKGLNLTPMFLNSSDYGNLVREAYLNTGEILKVAGIIK